MLDPDSDVAPRPLSIRLQPASPATRRDATVQHVRSGVALAYRADIEGLRGLAVALVIAYHAFPRLRSGGFVGVDVFFVISGYLITQIVLLNLRSGNFSLIEFYRRRVLRIVPALLVVLTASCILAWLLLLPSELRSFGGSVKWSSLLLANLFFALQTGGYFDPAADSNPLLHLWSLGVEEQFYLAWPVLLIMTRWRGATMPVLSLLIAVSLGLSILSALAGSSPHFFNPLSRAWELAIGGALAAWPLAQPRQPAALRPSVPRAGRWVADGVSMTGLALIVIGGACWTVDRRIPGFWSVIPTVGAVLVIGAGPSALGNHGLLDSRPMTFIGRISYPLYLWHWPLFSFTRIVLGRPAPPILAIGEIAIALVAAYATFRFIERPTRSGALGAMAAPALLCGLLLLAVAGAALQEPWISGRLRGPIVSQWDAAATDWRFSGDSQIDERSGFGTLTVASRSSRKALFIGDSHIQQYWPRVRRIIDAHPDAARSAVFVSFTAWPPLPGIGRVKHSPQSRAFFDRGMELALGADVDTVAIGAFWESYFLGEYSPDRNLHAVYGVPTPPLRLDSPGTQVAFEQFERDIARLVASGRRVFLILSNPTSPLLVPLFPPEARLSLHLPNRLRGGTAASFDAAPFESFVSPLMSRLRTIAARTGAIVVDPRLTLCDGMICPVTDSNGMPLYLDSNHLNGANARERASFVDDMLLGPTRH